VAIGLPTVTVNPEQMESLLRSVESNPQAVFAVDLESKTLAFGETRIAIDIPESHRKALTEGTWDSTSMLLANLEKVKGTASRLPYTHGFPG
jgi:3-isopropylmalate/(R)-2-methylmalate dehydratase small subunit